MERFKSQQDAPSAKRARVENAVDSQQTTASQPAACQEAVSLSISNTLADKGQEAAAKSDPQPVQQEGQQVSVQQEASDKSKAEDQAAEGQADQAVAPAKQQQGEVTEACQPSTDGQVGQ
jgi:hypothetical protein